MLAYLPIIRNFPIIVFALLKWFKRNRLLLQDEDDSAGLLKSAFK